MEAKGMKILGYDSGYNDGCKDGIKEVVDWIEKNRYASSFSYHDDFSLDSNVWQAFLKEKGID